MGAVDLQQEQEVQEVQEVKEVQEVFTTGYPFVRCARCSGAVQ